MKEVLLVLIGVGLVVLGNIVTHAYQERTKKSQLRQNACYNLTVQIITFSGWVEIQLGHYVEYCYQERRLRFMQKGHEYEATSINLRNADKYLEESKIETYKSAGVLLALINDVVKYFSTRKEISRIIEIRSQFGGFELEFDVSDLRNSEIEDLISNRNKVVRRANEYIHANFEDPLKELRELVQKINTD